MSEPRRCPQCDAEIPANSPAGLCPRCLLQATADSQSAGAVEPGPTQLTPPKESGFVPPTVEELAPLFPQLEILELLGKGGMGAVYKARQPGLDRLVALKILPPEISRDPAFTERFQREARALARLSHPHIVAVYDFGTTDRARRGSPDPAAGLTEGLPSSDEPQETSGQPGGSVGDRPQREGGLCYIVMEFVDGANLRQTIRAGKLAAAEALAIVPQICEALQFAHDEGIVHRDIKPENILIDKRGRVKIADFGLAKLLGQDASDHSLTATHQVMGTLRYMAPEQMQGSREVDHRADIYSLGVVFYELLTGELPMGRFAPPSKRVQVDVRLDEIVLRALEQEPEQRYQHASEVKSDLESVTSELSVQAATKTATRPATAATGTGSDSTHAGTPLTQMRFMVEDSANVAQQAVFYFSSLGYELAERRADVCVFRRGGQWAGLWETDIRKIATRLTVRTAPAGEGQQWVSCDWSVRTLGAWVTRRDIRQLEAEGYGFQSLLGVALSPDLPIAGPPSEPRFSRFAIAGAVWALFGVLAVIPTLYFIGLNRVWNGTALPTDVIHSEPPLVFSIFMGALLAIGSGAPIGTTVYGALAIGHIKRSDGKIVGLSLAVADVLFFPLLVFGGLIAALVARAGFAMAPNPNAADVTSAGAFGVLVALVVCFFVGRAVWRAIAGHDQPSDQTRLAAMAQASETATDPVSSLDLVQAPADCLLLAAGIAFVTACGVAIWLLAVLGYSSNEFTNLMVRRNLIGMSATLAIYSVLIGIAGLMLRRLRVRLVVLLVAVIVGLFFPAVVALNVVMELRNIPMWPVVIPLWLGMPAALWVVVTLFRADVRRAFDATAEQRRLRDGDEPPQQTPSIANEPRLSRLALWGAILTVLGVLAFLGFLFVGMVVFSHLFVEHNGSTNIPPLGISIAEWLLVTVSGLAAIGAPVCGAAAISQIQKSNGQLYGLPLARGCVLCAPLLVLGGITGTLTQYTCIEVWTNWPGPAPDLTADEPPGGPPGGLFTVLAAIAALVVNFFVGRAMWRAIAGNNRLGDQLPGNHVEAKSGASQSNGVGRISLWTAIVGVVLPVLLALGAQLVVPSSERLSDFLVLCVVLGGLLELVAFGCGIVARRTGSGKAGLFIASVALVLCLLVFAVAPVASGPSDAGPTETATDSVRLPDSAQQKTGEVWSGNKGAEHVMFWGPNSPTVSDRLASHLGLDASQRSAMDQAFQRYDRAIRALEDQNTRHETDANGHQITTIAPLLKQLPQLAEQFWSELDSALDGQQLTLGRKTVWLSGGMFQFADLGYRIEIWRVGQINPWYHWKESYPGRSSAPTDVAPYSGPELPEKFRRFWTEPGTDDATTAALLDAAAQGQTGRIKQLLDAGASLNAKDSEGQTPLIKAVANGHRALALSLFLLGADIAEQDQRGRTAEMIAAEKRDATFLSRLKELSQISFDTDPAKRKERLRAFSGIEHSLLAGRDVDLVLFSSYEAERLQDNDGENALMKAARSGDWECFNLLATQTDTMQAQDKLGRTVLMHAVLGGHAEESGWKEQIEWLTKPPYFGIAGVDNVYVGAMVVFDLEKSLSVFDRDSKSVLQLAEQHKSLEVARILRRHLEMIITNQTAEVQKGGDSAAKHLRLRALAWRSLGEIEKSEADFKKALPE